MAKAVGYDMQIERDLVQNENRLVTEEIGRARECYWENKLYFRTAV